MRIRKCSANILERLKLLANIWQNTKEIEANGHVSMAGQGAAKDPH